MARKADRSPGGKVIGRRGGEPEWSRLQRTEHGPGRETSARLVSVTCHCGARVGELWHNHPEDPARGAYWTLMTTITEDPAARPVAQRFVDQTVTPGSTIPADCPGHGRLSVPSDALLRAGRRAASRRGAGDKLMRFVVPGAS